MRSVWGLIFTICCIVAAIATMIGYLTGGEPTTISQWLTNLAWYSPVIPYAAGYLSCHWFGGIMRSPCPRCSYPDSINRTEAAKSDPYSHHFP